MRRTIEHVPETTQWSNLGNTCYLNAVCQVVFHCDAARNFLRVADDDSTQLVQELQSLAQKLADGLPTEMPGQRCRVDVGRRMTLLTRFCNVALCDWGSSTMPGKP